MEFYSPQKLPQKLPQAVKTESLSIGILRTPQANVGRILTDIQLVAEDVNKLTQGMVSATIHLVERGRILN